MPENDEPIREFDAEEQFPLCIACTEVNLPFLPCFSKLLRLLTFKREGVGVCLRREMHAGINAFTCI